MIKSLNDELQDLYHQNYGEWRYPDDELHGIICKIEEIILKVNSLEKHTHLQDGVMYTKDD